MADTTKDSIEKHGFKISIAVAVMVIIFLIATTAQTASWKTSMEAEHKAMETRQDHLSDGHASLRDSIQDLEKRQDGTDINMAEIKTKLSNIEALLVEIKADLKENN